MMEITRPVVQSMISHALTNEKEEIMGLLLGNKEKDKLNVWGLMPLQRTDRKKDRVEVSPEDSAKGMERAETITRRTRMRTRVIGWYHSHPHITILPSHVDVRTQWNYQRMESDFVGMIVSCYDHNAEQRARVQMVAFRSLEFRASEVDAPEWKHILVPFQIVEEPETLSKAHGRESLVELQKMMLEEEKRYFMQSSGGDSLLRLHNTAVWQRMLCELASCGTLPLVESFCCEIENARVRSQALKNEIEMAKRKR